MGFEPAKAVMRVVANFSRMEFKSSGLIRGDDAEVVGTDAEVDWFEVSKDAVLKILDPARTNFTAL